jgi:MFS family permease
VSLPVANFDQSLAELLYTNPHPIGYIAFPYRCCSEPVDWLTESSANARPPANLRGLPIPAFFGPSCSRNGAISSFMSTQLSEPPLETETFAAEPYPSEAMASPRPGLRWHPAWAVLGIAAAAQFMSAPGQSYSVAAFIDPMLSDLSLLRTEFSMAYLVATLVSGATLPFVGRLADRYGARIMMPTVALLLGFACLWMSRIGGVVGLYVGFTLIRCLGQGSLTMISTWLVGEWFDKRRGLAMGLIGLGGSFSVMTFPQLNNFLINEFGWRSTWLVLAGAVVGVMVLPAILLVRNKPEEMGLLPDGHFPDDLSDDGFAVDSDPNIDMSVSHDLANESWTAVEAWRTATFWKMTSVIATGALVGTGLIFHQVSLLGAYGISREWALGLLGVQALVATLGAVVAGYLSDRLPPRYLLACSMAMVGGALLLLLLLGQLTPTATVGSGDPPMFVGVIAVIYASLLGMHGAIMRSAGTVVWVNFFGRLHQGAVRGAALSLAVAAAALGPLPLALSKDMFGGYGPALAMFLVLPIMSGWWVRSAKRPRRTVSPGV